mmetsp:Transcript_36285/g.95067  ORF Transcript_36285/g.95067 Transcript_36285/m.95067 type:complete len:296 (+) Transcript_36285:250-1137(+)
MGTSETALGAFGSWCTRTPWRRRTRARAVLRGFPSRLSRSTGRWRCRATSLPSSPPALSSRCRHGPMSPTCLTFASTHSTRSAESTDQALKERTHLCLHRTARSTREGAPGSLAAGASVALDPITRRIRSSQRGNGILTERNRSTRPGTPSYSSLPSGGRTRETGQYLAAWWILARTSPLPSSASLVRRQWQRWRWSPSSETASWPSSTACSSAGSSSTVAMSTTSATLTTRGLKRRASTSMTKQARPYQSLNSRQATMQATSPGRPITKECRCTPRTLILSAPCTKCVSAGIAM